MTRRCCKYGSDKPDLRNPIEMDNVTEHFRGSGFKVFAGMLEKDGPRTCGRIPAPGGGSRAFCDKMNSWAQQRGPTGPWLHLLARGRGRRRGPDRQEHRTGARQAIREQFGLKVGDAVFFVGGRSEGVLQVRGRGA
jgi:aspartyl-tRNA synthetase